jgi:hypothetical protein
MAGQRENDGSEAVRRAQALISEAMDLLDARGGYEPAAAHLALALEELRKPSSDFRT